MFSSRLRCLLCAIAPLFLLLSKAYADVHYVSPNGGDVHPYTNWSDAATVLQLAMDAADTGDTVLVTNGTYGLGDVGSGRDTRVVIGDGLTVRSVNGPTVTTIVGQHTGGTNLIRCASVGSNSVLCGFTLTNGCMWINMLTYPMAGDGGCIKCAPGATVSNCIISGGSALRGGGVYCAGIGACAIVDCTIADSYARKDGGGIYQGSVRRCRVSGNRARDFGGGCWRSTIIDSELFGNAAGLSGGGIEGPAAASNCTFRGNSAFIGGGASDATLMDCVVSSNSASYKGAGVDDCRVYDSAITGNSEVERGGGAHASELWRCLVQDNSAAFGGGVYGCDAWNCLIVRNEASGGVWMDIVEPCLAATTSDISPLDSPPPPPPDDGGSFFIPSQGGGARYSVLVNCTVWRNRATKGGGLGDSGTLNCIVYGNHASSEGDNSHSSPHLIGRYPCSYSCIHPDPGGVGNTTNPPLLTGDYRLTAGSPCIDAGVTNGAPLTDRDGWARWDHPGVSNVHGSAVDLGCYEFVDLDRDDMSDAWELEYFGSTNAANGQADDDQDGVCNLAEYESGANPHSGDTDGDALPDAWEIACGLSPCSARHGHGQWHDFDGDGMPNYDEYRAGTDAGAEESVLRMDWVKSTRPGKDELCWQSAPGKNYTLFASPNLTDWSVLESNIVATPPTNQFRIDIRAAGFLFYRVGVCPPADAAGD